MLKDFVLKMRSLTAKSVLEIFIGAIGKASTFGRRLLLTTVLEGAKRDFIIMNLSLTTVSCANSSNVYTAWETESTRARERKFIRQCLVGNLQFCSTILSNRKSVRER